MDSIVHVVALICLGWSMIIIVVQTIGISAIFRYFSRRALPSASSKLGRDAPVVTIIRPVKGLEPQLHECIVSTLQQDYPPNKISLRLCIESETDAAYPVLTKLVSDFPGLDVKILLESQDVAIHGASDADKLGPNPKIRNISRAYREAKGDIIWIIDCNVWVARSVLGRMVDKLVGYSVQGRMAKPYKFVHQMPLVVDTVSYARSHTTATFPVATDTEPETRLGAEYSLSQILQNGGGRLDEMFMATTHVKFYGAINSVGIAPCIVGKSNMFRKSHLEQVTTASKNPILKSNGTGATGIDYFSHHICEDHLIGDLLWRSHISGYLNHGIVWGDLVVQPMAGMSIGAYAARRVRWLRARKFTVPAATLVEPGVESFLCCAYFAFALTSLPWVHTYLAVPQTWSAMGFIWLSSVTAWMCVDWFIFRLLHTGQTIEIDDKTPTFARGTSHSGGMPRRPFHEWLVTWLGREAMALPIWTWAVLLGTTVTWRGNRFRVRLDTSVVEVSAKRTSPPRGASQAPELGRWKKGRQD